MASRMFSNDGYFPVPTMRRDLNSLPPSHRDVSCMASLLSAAHRADDLDLVALGQHRAGVFRFGSDLAVERDGGELAAHAESREEPVDGEPIGKLHGIPVHRQLHRRTSSGT